MRPLVLIAALTMILLSIQVVMLVIVINLYKGQTDPFAKCIGLPSSDAANYWRCDK